MSGSLFKFLPRVEKAAEVRRLVERDYLQREIAEELGISRSYVSELIRDPDGSAAIARKASYGRPCRKCGRLTDGSNGRDKAPELCLSCYYEEIAPPHGTRSRYNTGCSCDDCRRANREHQRALKGRPAPSHGLSGYTNYGCRCEVCTRANTERHGSYQAAWRRRRRLASS